MAGGGALAVSAAALTDHVCDGWHGLPRVRLPLLGEPSPAGGPRIHGICIVSGSISSNGGKVASELRLHRQTAGWVSVKKSQIREWVDG
jgi:hypothetical protein